MLAIRDKESKIVLCYCFTLDEAKKQVRIWQREDEHDKVDEQYEIVKLYKLFAVYDRNNRYLLATDGTGVWKCIYADDAADEYLYESDNYEYVIARMRKAIAKRKLDGADAYFDRASEDTVVSKFNGLRTNDVLKELLATSGRLVGQIDSCFRPINF